MPIFIDFMQGALKDQPDADFTAPKEAKIAYAHGAREAFRPGTEPKPPPPRAAAEPGAPPPMGPIPYNQAFPAAAPPAPPPAAKRPQDLTGLY